METSAQFSRLKAFYSQIVPNLSESGWQVCESVLSVRTLKKGELLLRQGAVCNNVSFINKGLLRMYTTTADGRDKLTEFFREGDYTADYRSFLLREPSLTSIQALEDTEVVETSYDDLQMIYRKVPEANLLGRLIAEELFIDVCKRTGAQVGEPIETQYNNLIAESPWLLQRVPQYMIASYLGITPEALSRIKARSVLKTKRPELV